MVELRYLMLFVSDLSRSTRFYRDGLGLTVRSETRDTVEFDAGGLVLSLHQAHSEAAHHHPPTMSGGQRLGFHVEQLPAVHERLVREGARTVSPPEERYGVQMALYEDPDGFNFTVAGSA